MIVDLLERTRFHISSKNATLHRSSLIFFASRHKLRSTTTCVDIPAWSVPGIHTTRLPCKRAYLTIASSTASMTACHKCKSPVTFGGGSGTTNVSQSASKDGEKYPCSIHEAYISFSNDGSYFLGIIDIRKATTKIKEEILFSNFFLYTDVCVFCLLLQVPTSPNTIETLASLHIRDKIFYNFFTSFLQFKYDIPCFTCIFWQICY